MRRPYSREPPAAKEGIPDMDKQQYDLKRIVQRISIFKDLEVEEVQLLLTLCQLASYPAGQQIYTAGELSRDMMVVLKGRLEVSTASGEPLGEIGSGTCTALCLS